MADVTMTPESDEVSLFAMINTILRNRWRILRWTIIGGAVAAALVMLKPATYTASSSFVPQGADAGRSNLASLAGQLGVSLPTSNQSLSPDFYAALLKSRVLLRSIARDTLSVRERGGRRVAFLDLFEAPGGNASGREEQGVRILSRLVNVGVDKVTGIVSLTVSTKWPSVSLAIVNSLVAGVSDFNQKTRQSQAAAERRFVEGRLAVAASDLRAAEDRLESFLQNNRFCCGSPELQFQKDRLQRDVTLRQQVYTSLTESYEEVRIREVRDTPVITVIEAPAVATTPEARGRVTRVLLGLFLGALIGILLSFMSSAIARVREEGDQEADAFAGTLGEVKGEMLRPVHWVRDRFQRTAS